MIARRVVLGGMTGAAAALLGGCSILFPAKYRFRMTAEVQTPQGLKTGSSVYELEAHKTFALTSEENEGGGAFRGQATMVNLPDGPLFILLKTNTAGVDLGNAATLAFSLDAQTGHVDDYIAAVRALGRTNGVKTELPRKDWPLMVRFGSLDDPKSVEKVDPEVIGVKRIVLETTSDAVTTGIEKRLRWLGDDPLTYGGHGTMGPDMAGGPLNNRAFWSGTAK
jgi:hypothetical protein